MLEQFFYIASNGEELGFCVVWCWKGVERILHPVSITNFAACEAPRAALSNWIEDYLQAPGYLEHANSDEQVNLLWLYGFAVNMLPNSVQGRSLHTDMCVDMITGENQVLILSQAN
jgi:hypothetical protein